MKQTDRNDHEKEMLEQMIKYSSQKVLEDQGDLLEEGDELELPQDLQCSILKMIEEKRAEEHKQQKQLARRELRRKVFKKMVASISLVIAIGLIGGSLIMTVDAWRIPILNFVFSIGEEKTKMQFKNSNEDSPASFSSEMPYPKYIPQGFSIATTTNDEATSSIVYNNSNNQYIVFVHHRSDETTLTLFTNEEKTPIKVNGYDGYLISHPDGPAIIWGVEDYFFRVYGNVSKEEIIKIAESVE